MHRHALRVAVCAATMVAASHAGAPPTVELKTDSSGIMLINVANGLAIFADVHDADDDLAAVHARLTQGATVLHDGPFHFSPNSKFLWIPDAPSGFIPEALHDLEVTATDAEGNSTSVACKLQAHRPPAFQAITLDPPAPTASEPVVISFHVEDESDCWGSASLYEEGSWSAVLTQDLTWGPASPVAQWTLTDLPYAGDWRVSFTAHDPFGGTAQGGADVTVSPADLLLHEVSPASGFLQAADPVTLVGDGFLQYVDFASVEVRFGDTWVGVPPWTTTDDEHLVVVPPPAMTAGPVAVTVRLTKGGVAHEVTLPDAYTYLPGPAIASFDPRGAASTQPFELRVVGSGFAGSDVQVRLGDATPTSVEAWDDGELRAVFAPFGEGPFLPLDLTVSVDGVDAVWEAAFEVSTPAMRRIADLGPPSAAPTRGAAFVGWLDSPGQPGHVVLARPDAAAGSRLVAVSAADGAAWGSIESWLPLAAPVSVAGFAPEEDFGFGFSGSSAPALAVGEPAGPWGHGRVHSIFSGTWDVAEADDELGFAMAAMRDRDHDGVSDKLVIGAPGTGALCVLAYHYGSYAALDVAFESAEEGDRLGESVAGRQFGEREFAAAGAPNSGHSGFPASGAVFLFEADPWWGELVLLRRFDGDEVDQNQGPLGRAMPLALLQPPNTDAPPVVVVGHPGSAGQRGRVEALDGSSGLVRWSASGIDVGDGFGHALAAIADLDRDGVDEVAVGSPGSDFGGVVDRGAVFVLSGATGVVLQRFDGDAAGERLGAALSMIPAASGDLLPQLLGATDAVAGPNEVRRFLPDPACFTVATLPGASMEGLLSSSEDVDGLSFDLVEGERIEVRLHAVGAWNDPVLVALVDDDGTVLVSNQGGVFGEPGPGVTATKDGWRLRHEADGPLRAHVLLRAPRTSLARPYLVETERLAGGEWQWKVKKDLAKGSSGALYLPVPAPAGHWVHGTVKAKGLPVVAVSLMTPSGPCPSWWKKPTPDLLLFSGLASAGASDVRIEYGAMPKDRKLKAKWKMVKPTSSWTIQEGNLPGGD